MGCGGTLYNTRGVVTSPNFPQAHAQLSNCQWTLKVPPGQKIELRFTRKKKIWFFIRAYATYVARDIAQCLKIMKKSHSSFLAYLNELLSIRNVNFARFVRNVSK